MLSCAGADKKMVKIKNRVYKLISAKLLQDNIDESKYQYKML